MAQCKVGRCVLPNTIRHEPMLIFAKGPKASIQGTGQQDGRRLEKGGRKQGRRKKAVRTKEGRKKEKGNSPSPSSSSSASSNPVS
jgi:hypothetical protein